MAEQAHVSALQACGARVPRPKRSRVKGTDLQVDSAEAKIFRLRQESSMRELKLRKLLGRILEVEMQQQRGHAVPGILYRRIFQHRFLLDHQVHTLSEAKQRVQQELRDHVHAVQLQQLQHWREQMRADVRQTSKWVKKSNNLPVRSVFDDTFKNGEPSNSDQESLEAVLSFWQRIWARNLPSVNDAFDFWQLGINQPPPLEWSPITAHELQTQARRMAGTAAGPDGWSGDDISCWPTEAWAIMAVLVERWLSRREVPAVWSSVRQVLLEKPNAAVRDVDQALAAKHLRPIAIQSVIWRAVASSWTRRPQTRTWVKSWVHESACGGIQGKSVAHAVDKLLQDFEKRRGGVLLSLDYAKCFDMVNPELAIKCLRHLGCPDQIVFALAQVWDQQRWLCFRRDCLPNPEHVTTSIPQGDAISPLTLLALLTGLTGRVLQERAEPHTLVTFLDDRNLVAKTPEDAAKLWKTWKELSPLVGLKENEAKVQVVPRAKDFKPRLLQAGFLESQMVDSARVLGVDITARLGAAHRPTKDMRIHEARARLERIGLLPVSVDFKAALTSSLAIPKAVWGLWLTPFSIKPLATQIKRITGGQHVAGSNNLFFLLAGHGLHPYFAAGFGAYHFLANVVRHHPRPWPHSSARGTWLGTVRQWLLGLQWQEQGAWVWTHPSINFRVDWTQPITEEIKNKEHHALREAWRREQFALWQSSGRRDANAALGCNYNEKRVACARKMFRSCNTHSRACMIGAVVSDARLDKIRNPDQPPDPCSWCSSGDAPTWHHLAWECAAFSGTRCRRPRDPLQKILGWPTGRNPEQDASVLAHLGTVRERMLDRRYRGNY